MDSRLSTALARRVPWILAAGIFGAMVFLLVQSLAGFSNNIADFVGQQIVRNGGYGDSLAGPIGYTVHFGVALTYAALFGLIVQLIPLPEKRTARWTTAGVVALALGWLTNLIAPPAIAVTTSVLGARGLPDSLPGLNSGFGLPFWNHIIFFGIVWALAVVAPEALRPSEPAGQSTAGTAV